MIAIAQDSLGAERVSAAVAGMQLEFPVLLDEGSSVAREFGFRIVPAAIMFEADGRVAYSSDADFDIGDPRVRVALESFLSGGPVQLEDAPRPMSPQAMRLFSDGARAHADGMVERALELWREALDLDPENFLIRSQIWAAEHPERFWPVVDRDWQERQLMKEGYDGPLP